MININQAIDQMMEQEVPKAKKSEAVYRNNLIGLARQCGIEGDLIKIFNKYDDMLKKCNNPVEYKLIAVSGILEINNLFKFKALAVNNVQVIPADPSEKV